MRLSGVGFDADGNLGAVSNAVSVLTQKAGWTVGAGLEGRLFGNVTGKIEYLYMDFGTISTSVANPLNATPVTLSSNSRITDNIVRVGLNYKLDPALGVYDVLAGVGAPSVYQALPYKAPSALGTPVVTSWTWAGPYLGLNAGYGFGAKVRIGDIPGDGDAAAAFRFNGLPGFFRRGQPAGNVDAGAAL